MAATKNMADDDSSSSDDEALKRCQEAVWDSHAITAKDKVDNKKPSKRLVVADHEHDGNELQVTPGFQTHVATKLGAMLDSLISEKQPSIQPTVNINPPNPPEEEDEGFRLFSTSVPGVESVEPPPPKRPLPSSSDSDSEMESRFKEAAVSISDIFTSSVTMLPTSPAVPEMSSSETPVKVKKKKKKKRELNPEENGHVNGNQSNIINQENTTVKDKKKKKKVTPGDSEQVVDKPEESSPPKSLIPITRDGEHEIPEILPSATALPNNPAETRSSDTQEKVKKKKKKRKPYLEENGQHKSHYTTTKDIQCSIVNQDEDQTAKHKKKKKKTISNSDILS